MNALYIHLSSLAEKRANVIQVMQMCNALEEAGIAVTLAIPKNSHRSGNMETIRDELGRPAGFKVQEYSKYTIRGRPMSLGAYWGVRSILDKDRHYDFCYTRNFFLANLAINKGLKTIYEEHYDRLHPSSLLNRWYIKEFLKNVHSVNLIKIVTISQALADIWRKRGVPSEKMSVLHDGVALEDYAAVKGRDQARLELGIKTKKKIVVYAGSLYGDRGIENILKAADSFPEAYFIVVGGPEKHKRMYESKAAKRGLTNIIFKGRVPHHKVRDYLFAADVLIALFSRRVPTINVCSPLKVFEYMAAERIILTQDFPVIREVLKDGDNALLADPDSYEDLESKMRHALSIEYPNALAIKARIDAFNKYSWKKRAEAILNILK